MVIIRIGHNIVVGTGAKIISSLVAAEWANHISANQLIPQKMEWRATVRVYLSDCCPRVDNCLQLMWENLPNFAKKLSTFNGNLPNDIKDVLNIEWKCIWPVHFGPFPSSRASLSFHCSKGILFIVLILHPKYIASLPPGLPLMEQEHAKVPQSVHSSSAVLTDRREVAGKFLFFWAADSSAGSLYTFMFYQGRTSLNQFR